MAKHAPKSAGTHITGKVTAVNLSPKGRVEGALVTTATGVVQLNLPKHAEPGGLRLVVGARVDTAAELEDSDDGAHPVYEACDVAAAREGTVARFNYARHGEINGYHLDDGAFVHVKPDGAARYKVKVGDRIRVDGRAHRGDDAVVVEATSVTKLRGK